MCGRVACDLGPKLSMLPLLLCFMLLTSLTVNTRATPDYPDSRPSSVAQYLKSLESVLAEQEGRASADEEEKTQYDQRQQVEEGGSAPQENQPLFTYRFPEELFEESPFAIKPTDPRYYDPDVPLVRNSDVVSKSNANKTKQEAEKEKSEAPAWFGLGKSGEPNRLEEESRMAASEAADKELQEENVYKIPIVGIKGTKEDMLFIAIVAGCSAAAVVGVILIGITWYRGQENNFISTTVSQVIKRY